ncbi:MAG: enolase C-terminal domain-like protein [Sphaerochaetaceae bacterium]|nr:enolase C-terminal domain-like protein [Sphaerochaetaceae bacterium]
MLIKDITAHTVYTDYKEPWQHDKRFYVKTGQQANTIIVIHTDCDLIGIGEATHSPGLYGETPGSTVGALDLVRPYIIGKPALNRNLILNIVDRVMPLGNLAFISALDQALLDLAGKAYGLPVVDLLGGRAHELLPTHINPPTNENFLPLLEKFLNEGFRVFKIKMSGDTPYDLDLISSALKAVDETVTLSLDANQGWNVPQTLAIAARIEADPHYRDNVILEQPVHASDFEGMALIRRGTKLKLMADDCIRTVGDLARLINMQAADIVSIKISRCGGIRKCQQMVAMAEAANMLYIIDEINEMRVANTAVAHLALSTRSPLYTGVTCHLLLRDDIVLEGGVRVENGMAVIGNEPGLGIGRVDLQNS